MNAQDGGVGAVVRSIYDIVGRREASTFALCVEYAARALAEFRSNQDLNFFWQNQTGFALSAMFSDAFRESGGSVMGWFMAHGAEYGVYLELANDRKYAAIWPTVLKFSYLFQRDLKILWGSGSMMTKIVAKLKTTSIKNVVVFGSPSPVAPYIVVKPEGGQRRQTFRVIIHMQPGQQAMLESYVRNDLPGALDHFRATDDGGSTNEIVPLEDQIPGIMPPSSDGTIAMERVYYMPDII